ncbi:FCD domain-containing protein [Iocasia frigidifontis]|uniref:FCD domain-containing protein n=1 Tax=Iocasia fonsfrigidae TaxID=2682810 RepID=A0A8A7KD25_9FIRM|nr:GntR family transcriptional regulator [Iocasia fonsfrigidae]QTL99676.1 FCD domain-containing protein [Iocasia fonsfrigidae]
MELHKHENNDYGYMKDYVYEVLKKNIIELRLKPGMNLKKEKIAKELEVSITPIREAFARLSEDELVDIYPQRGTYVSLINMKKVEQAKFMREHLERAVVRLACSDFPEDYILKLKTNIKIQEIYVEEENYIKLFELDNEFHKIIFDGCNKGDIWSSIQQLSNHVSRSRILSLAANFNGNELIVEHQKIVEAIQKGDKELADRIIAKHISRIKFDSNKLNMEYPGYFLKQ